MSESIIIVGAGLSGLSAAYKLEEFGYSPIIYEASDRSGGRMQTEIYKDYILDYGFHLVLSTYKDLFEVCSPKELEISYFPPGVMFQKNDEWTSILNPIRGPMTFENRSPFLFDFMKLGKLYLKYNQDLDHLPVSSLFQKIGLSKEVVEKVLRPFFACAFLDPDLQTSGKAFQHLLPFFVKGRGGLPRKGIHSIPETLEGKLKRTKIHYNAKIDRMEGGKLFLASGETITPDRTILALPTMAAASLIPSLPEKMVRSATHCYFAIDEGFFIPSPFLYLTKDRNNPITAFAVINLIQSSYAPEGKFLFSVAVLSEFYQNNPDLEKDIAEKLGSYFNVSGSRFEHLKTYHISHALPDQSANPPFAGNYRYDPEHHIYLSGELVDYPSYNGAVVSGTNAAEAVHQDIQKKGTI